MKKILILLSTLTFSSSSSVGITMNYKSFSLSESNDQKYVEDSKYVAINNIIGKNNNVTVNDLLAFEENNISNNTIANSTKHLFNTFQDENMMISSDSAIKYYESNNSTSFYSTNKSLISISNFLTQINASNENSIMQISQFANFTQILSSVVGNLINLNFSSILGNSINNILGNNNFIMAILDNISITQLLFEMNKFESYNSDGSVNLSNSPFNNKLYSDVVKSTEANFEDAIIDDADNSANIAKNMPTVIDGILMLMNFISQFPFDRSDPEVKNIFNSENNDKVVKTHVYAHKYSAINYGRLSDLFANLANADANNGLGIKQLMFILFGLSDYELDNQDVGISTIRTNPGPNHIKDDLRLKINSDVGPSSYQPMPGTNFAWNDPLINFTNGLLEATMHYLYKSKKISTDYIFPLKFTQSEVIYKISANANLDIIKDLIGPIIYRMINDIVENNYLNATYDTLITFVRAASLKKENGNINTPWEKDIDSKIKSTIGNFVDSNDSYFPPTLAGYPLSVPNKHILTKGDFANPSWHYNSYSNITISPINMWNDVWSGTGSDSILNKLSSLMNLLEGLIPQISSTSYSESSLPNIKFPENLKGSFDKFLSTKLFQNYTGEDMLNIIKGSLLSFDSLLSSVNELFNSLSNLNSKLKILYDTYIKSSDDSDTFKNIINRNGNYYNGSFGYLEAILYGVSKNYLFSSRNITDLNSDLFNILGYDSNKNEISSNSFIDTLFKSQLFKAGSNIISQIISVSKNNYMNNLNLNEWTITSPILKDKIWSYTLISPYKTNYLINLTKDKNDQFYSMTIKEK